MTGMFAFHTLVNLVATTFFICSRLKLVPPRATRSLTMPGLNWTFIVFRLKSVAPAKGETENVVALGGYLTVIIWTFSRSRFYIPSPPGVSGCRWHGREKDAVEPGSLLYITTLLNPIPFNLLTILPNCDMIHPLWTPSPPDGIQGKLGPRQLDPGAQLSALK